MSFSGSNLKNHINLNSIVVGRLLVPVVILALWAVAAQLYGVAVPELGSTYEAAVEGLSDGWLIYNLYVTLYTALYGFAVAGVGGIVLGLILGQSQFVRDVFEPILLGIYSVPKVTLYPLFLILLGLTIEARVAFGMFHGIFPVMILTIGGMKSIKESHMKVAKAFNLSVYQKFRYVVLPSILPSLITGLRLGFTLTFLGVILGEMFAGHEGLGNMIISAMVVTNMPDLYALVVTAALVGIVGNSLLYMIEIYVHRRTEEDAEISSL